MHAYYDDWGIISTHSTFTNAKNAQKAFSPFYSSDELSIIEQELDTVPYAPNPGDKPYAVSIDKDGASIKNTEDKELCLKRDSCLYGFDGDKKFSFFTFAKHEEEAIFLALEKLDQIKKDGEKE